MTAAALTLSVLLAANPGERATRLNLEPFVLIAAGAAGVGVGFSRVAAANRLADSFSLLPRTASSPAEAQAILRQGREYRFNGNAETQLAASLFVAGGGFIVAGVIWLAVQGLEVPVVWVAPGPGGPSAGVAFEF